MVFKEYSSIMIPAFVSLGSVGILMPYFLQGLIIISMVLFISLVLISRFLKTLGLSGYFNGFLASISLIFAIYYFSAPSIFYITSGIAISLVALYSIYIAAGETRWISSIG